MLARNGLLSLALSSLALAAVACGAEVDSAKKPLPVCDANDPQCPGIPASSSPKKPRSEIPTDPVPAPATPSEPAKEEVLPDAGVDAAPVVGQECGKLSTCCDQLGAAGYLTTTCKSVLSTNNEDACYSQHAAYKSGGDCT